MQSSHLHHSSLAVQLLEKTGSDSTFHTNIHPCCIFSLQHCKWPGFERKNLIYIWSHIFFRVWSRLLGQQRFLHARRRTSEELFSRCRLRRCLGLRTKKQNKKKARVFSCFQADSSLGKGPNYSEIFWDNSTFHALHVDVRTFWCHMENSSFFTTVVMSYIFASDKPCFLANKCWEDYGDLRRLLRKDRATNSLRRFARKKGEGVLQERYTDLLRPSINIYILYKYM